MRIFGWREFVTCFIVGAFLACAHQSVRSNIKEALKEEPSWTFVRPSGASASIEEILVDNSQEVWLRSPNSPYLSKPYGLRIRFDGTLDSKFSFALCSEDFSKVYEIEIAENAGVVQPAIITILERELQKLTILPPQNELERRNSLHKLIFGGFFAGFSALKATYVNLFTTSFVKDDKIRVEQQTQWEQITHDLLESLQRGWPSRIPSEHFGGEF